jgi:hypothetical protein
MSGSLPIVFQVKDSFKKNQFTKFLSDKFEFTCEDKDWITSCKIDSLGVTVRINKKKITIQGQLNKETREIISEINAFDQLTLDPKNLKIYEEIFQPKNGQIICQQCGKASEMIEGTSDDSGNPIFKSSCGHELETNSPLLIARNRILPDLNILISKTLSRLVSAGYFNGYEVVIPEYYDKFVDQCFSKGKRRESFLTEEKELNKLMRQGRIRIYAHPFVGNKIMNCSDEGKIEDDIIFDLAINTHSILITADKTLIDKSTRQNLECISFSQKVMDAAKERSKLS